MLKNNVEILKFLILIINIYILNGYEQNLVNSNNLILAKIIVHFSKLMLCLAILTRYGQNQTGTEKLLFLFSFCFDLVAFSK